MDIPFDFMRPLAFIRFLSDYVHLGGFSLIEWMKFFIGSYFAVTLISMFWSWFRRRGGFDSTEGVALGGNTED